MCNRVLIIGGAGFIGRNLCRYLLKLNYRVTSFDYAQVEYAENGVEYIRGDFLMIVSLEALSGTKTVLFML